MIFKRLFDIVASLCGKRLCESVRQSMYDNNGTLMGAFEESECAEFCLNECTWINFTSINRDIG